MLRSMQAARLAVRGPALARAYHYDKGTAADLMAKSCYSGVDFVISKDATVLEAITRMAGINLGCLAVSDAAGAFVGLVTERDYLKKVELQRKTAAGTKVSQIMTNRARIVTARHDEVPSALMAKMLNCVRQQRWWLATCVVGGFFVC